MNELATIPTDLIDAGPNDRQTFKRAELEELAESIRANGLAQPPTLRPVSGRYEIVAGERRIRAMRDVLEWTSIPAIVRELTDEQASAIMLVENVQRRDLDPLEEARGYQSRLDRFGWSRAELSRQSGMGDDRIRRRLALLSLAPESAYAVSTGQLPLTYAALMTSLDANRQLLALKAYQAGPITIETMRALCARLQSEQDQDSIFSADSFLSIADYTADAEAAVEASATLDEMEADPVGTVDIAKRLGVKPQTVAQWRYRDLLPEPRWVVSGQPCWQWSDIVAWARETGRLPE